MKTTIPCKFTKNTRSITSSAFQTDYFTEPTTWMYEDPYLAPNHNNNEIVPYSYGFRPIYGFGFILVCLTIFFLCSLLYRTIKEIAEKQREDNVERRLTLGDRQPRHIPSVNIIQETAPKRHIRPSISTLFPQRTLPRTSTSASSLRRSSPESMATFEPLESYRFIHPDIPGVHIGPMRSSTPDSDFLPLHDRTIKSPAPLTDDDDNDDGIRERTSFPDSARWHASDPDSISLKCQSIPKNS